MSMKTFILSIGLLFLISSAFAFEEHTCNHDDLDFVAEDIDVEEDMSSLSAGRVLASSEYPRMRIVANYDNLNSAPSSFKAYIQNELAPPVLDYLSAALPVKYPVSGKLKVSSSSSCDVKTPSDLKSGVDADLYVIFDSRSEDSTVVASSRHCSTASGTKRPIVAYTNFNRQMLQEAKGDILLHEKNMYLLIHEIMHTLGVSKNSFDSFLDANGKTRKGHMKTVSVGGVKSTVIDIPELTEKLRNFYGCPTIPGLVMEADGGSGTAISHVERKFFVYDVMASGGIFGRRVSEFTLALLEGSGWYAPNYNYAEPYFFGKGQGCNFLNQKCSSSKAYFTEFCTGSSRGCAPQGRSGGKCASDSKANSCKYIDPDTDYDCDNTDAEDNARIPDLEVYGRGAESKCFSGTLNTRKSSNGATSFCFKYTCVGEGSTVQVEVQMGDKKIVCDKAGQKTLDGYYGYINCPEPTSFCEGVGKRYCPRGCMGRGECVDYKCKCNEGFTGVDCGIKA
jgi:leishmanolysin